MLREGQLRATFNTSSESWNMVTNRGSIIIGQWQYVEVSWQLDKGAYAHIGKRRSQIVQSHTNISDVDARRRIQSNSTVYLGLFQQPNDRPSRQQDLRVLVDELVIWFADRDHLKAFGFLEDGRRFSFFNVCS